MNVIIMLVILAVTTLEYLTQIHLLPRVAKYTPDILSAIMAVLVLIYGTRSRFRFVRPAYWFVFGAILVTIACGVLANSVDAGPVVSGMRKYLRAMPLFFLPAAYAFSEKQIRSQLLLLLLLCVPQFPLALHQRTETLATGGVSGDATTGMLANSGYLSIFLICALCLLTAAFLRKRIRPGWYFALFLVVLAPTTINETKATVILLPVGLMITFVAASVGRARLKSYLTAATLLLISGAIFVPVYDHFAALRGIPTIVEFYTNPEAFDVYMNKNLTGGTHKYVQKVGRIEAITGPLREVARDPTHFAFGLGIGNVSQSPLGAHFTGAYFHKYSPLLRTTASVLILEIGVLGLSLVLLLCYLIYRDARVVARLDEGVMGVLAAGWAGVAAVLVVATFYKTTITSDALSYLFWYFSGVVAAHRVRLARLPIESPAARPTNAPARLRTRPA